MRRPQLACLLLPLVSLPALHFVHAQDQMDSEPDVEGVWVDATSNAKAWLDSGNSLPFPVAFSPETVGMSSAHLEEADNRIEALVRQSTSSLAREGGREDRDGKDGKEDNRGTDVFDNRGTDVFVFTRKRGMPGSRSVCSLHVTNPLFLPPSLPHSLPPSLPFSLPLLLPTMSRKNRRGLLFGNARRADRDDADVRLLQRGDRATHPGGTSLPPSLPSFFIPTTHLKGLRLLNMRLGHKE